MPGETTETVTWNFLLGFIYPCVRHWTNHKEGWLKEGITTEKNSVDLQIKYTVRTEVKLVPMAFRVPFGFVTSFPSYQVVYMKQNVSSVSSYQALTGLVWKALIFY